MLPSPVKAPSFGIVVPSGSHPRYHQFEQSLQAVWATDGSGLQRQQGPSLAWNLNRAIKLFMREPTEYFVFLDDDHEFDQDLAVRLVNRKLPVVVGLTSMSRPPFDPVIYQGREKVGASWYYRPFQWVDLDGKHGLVDVYACGRAGLCVRRDVLERLGEPWFRLGQVNPDQANEDVDFCERVTALGYGIKCDLDAVFGHIAPCTIRPTRDLLGRWVPRLTWENAKGFTGSRGQV